MTDSPRDAVPVFEIDQADEFAEYLLHDDVDIVFNLNVLLRQRAVLTLYFGDGENFVLTSLLEIDKANRLIYLDAGESSAYSRLLQSGQRLTLSGSTLERIKIQARLGPLRQVQHNGMAAFAAELPTTLLRLQRRAFYRMATPRANPVRCTLLINDTETLRLPLHDISGGGLCLLGRMDYLSHFPLGHLLHDARLEIPGEGVLSINLRICEVLMTETEIGEPQLRVGCEFISLPANRQQLIERYITRLERERKATA